MRILWHSNAAFSQSGYGNQTDVFTQRLAKAGHDVHVSAFYGLRGAKLNYGGVEHLPGSFHEYGDDIIESHYQFYKPDVFVTLLDVWVMSLETVKRVPLTMWVPIDHDPMPPAVLSRLVHAKHIWAMSQFGMAKCKAEGLDADYVPHGVDTGAYFPADRAKMRRIIGLPDDAFVALMVAANKGYPARKNFDRVFKAWGKFARQHPGSILWVHSNPLPVHSGLPLDKVAEFYGCPPGSVQFPDQYRMMRGEYGEVAMNALYNAADVMVLPSAGGGFEIPLIEAQAAGCPVVTTKFTAMAELVGPGYGIEIDPFDGLSYTLQHSEQANVLPSQILAGLEWAWEHKGDTRLREQCREFAVEYAADYVLDRYMMPALEKAGARALKRDARTMMRMAKRQTARQIAEVQA